MMKKFLYLSCIAWGILFLSTGLCAAVHYHECRINDCKTDPEKLIVALRAEKRNFTIGFEKRDGRATMYIVYRARREARAGVIAANGAVGFLFEFAPAKEDEITPAEMRLIIGTELEWLAQKRIVDLSAADRKEIAGILNRHEYLPDTIHHGDTWTFGIRRGLNLLEVALP